MSRAVVAIMMALATFVATATVATAARPHAAPLGTPRDEGYLFVHFTGEGTANGEQIHFAASRGNAPLTFDELNDGRPVLTSPLGERGVRDPFIIRSPDGGKFYPLADLEIFDNRDWVEAQRHGSRSAELRELKAPAVIDPAGGRPRQVG